MAEVIFRRINGRIVPIREEHSGVQKSAALVGSGIGTGAIAGRAAASFHRDAAKYENAAHTLKAKARFVNHSPGPLFEAAKKQRVKGMFRQAAKNKLEAKRLFKAGQKIKYAGVAAAGALIGAGVNEGLKQTPLNEHERTRVAVATGAGLGGAFAVRSGYLKHMAGKTVRGWDILKHAAKRVGARGRKL